MPRYTYLKDLAVDPTLLDDLRKVAACACGNALPDSDEDSFQIGDDLVCADCFYEQLGELIERRAIGGISMTMVDRAVEKIRLSKRGI